MCRVGWKRQLTISSPTALPDSGLAYAQGTEGTVTAGAQSALPTRPVAGLLLVHTQHERAPGRATAGLAPPTQRQHTHTREHGAQALPPAATHRVPSDRPTDQRSLLWAQGSTPIGGAWTLGGQGSGGGGRAAGWQGAEPSVEGSHPAPEGQATPFLKTVGGSGHLLTIVFSLFVIPRTVAHQSSVQGISQARILLWVAISFSRESSRVSCVIRRNLYPLGHIHPPLNVGHKLRQF